MKKTNIVATIEELRAKADKLEMYSYIIESIENSMKWDCMKCQFDDEGKEQYIEPTEDDWRYEKFCAYQDILNFINAGIAKM